MAAFLIKRLGGALAVLLATSLLAYLFIFLAPGDPATVIVAQRIGRLPTAAEVELTRAEFGLDQPLYAQYAAWLGHAMRGDFGLSMRTGLPVLNEIASRARATLLLSFAATVFAALIGIPSGFLSGLRPNTAWDHLARLAALVSVSIPNFWLAFLLILLFSIYLKWLPTHGMRGPQYLVLPVVCLGLANAARISRLTRSCLLEVRHQDYIRTAHAKGLSHRSVWVRHALPNVLVPLITLLTSQFGALVAGSVIIETLFAWPGIGNYYVTAVRFRDVPVIQAAVVLFGVVFVLTNLCADMLCALSDPRIRLE